MDDRDGIRAAWAADLVSAGSVDGVDKIVPDAVDDDDFWIGDQWENDRFYLSISDFDYICTSSTQFNPNPDDDWGYTAPYYFQIKLTFHAGESNPS